MSFPAAAAATVAARVYSLARDSLELPFCISPLLHPLILHPLILHPLILHPLILHYSPSLARLFGTTIFPLDLTEKETIPTRVGAHHISSFFQ